MELKYHAIILGKNDVGETDRIYSAYTKEAGKLRLLAKGVRRPNARLAGNLETLTHSEIFVAKSRGSGNITGVIASDNFLGIKNNISVLEQVFYVLKVFDQLVTQEEKDEKIFSLLLGYLRLSEEFSNKDQEKVEILTLGFLFKLLENLGYALQVKKCAKCSKNLLPGENYFSAERGGIVCGDCFRTENKRIKVEDSAVKLIRIFSQNSLENLKKLKVDEKTLKNLKMIIDEEIRWIT